MQWGSRLPSCLHPNFQAPVDESLDAMKARQRAEVLAFEKFGMEIREEYSKPLERTRAIQQLAELKRQMKERHANEEAARERSGIPEHRLPQIALAPPEPAPTAKPENSAPQETEPTRGLIGQAAVRAAREAERPDTKVLRSTAHRGPMEEAILERHIKQGDSRVGPGARFGCIKGINQKAAAAGKRVCEVGTDGDCLYAALLVAACEIPSPDSIAALRARVAEHLESHADLYAEMVGTLAQCTLHLYLEGVRNGAPGGELELSVLAKVLAARITVLHPSEENRVYVPDGTTSIDLWLAFYPSYTILGDPHYNALK